jgi:hypothetical protein
MELMQEEKRKEKEKENGKAMSQLRNKEKTLSKNKKIWQGAINSTLGYHHFIYLCYLLCDYLSIINLI